MGAYQAGSDPTLDLAINRMPLIQQFLRQDLDECAKIEESLERLNQILPDVPQTTNG